MEPSAARLPSIGGRDGTASTAQAQKFDPCALRSDWKTCQLQHCLLPKSDRAIQLSWPRLGDTKRARLGQSPAPRPRSPNGTRHQPHKRSQTTRIVHVSQRDIEMHYYLNTSAEEARSQPTLEPPLAWNPAVIKADDQDLLEHFQKSASKSLAIFGHDSFELGNALIRIALANTSASATAVLQCLLAFSALHRDDVHSQAFELKITALQALGAASSITPIGTTEAIQHVAAGMLLCSFEAHKSSCTSGEWTIYLENCKKVIEAVGLDKIEGDEDLAMILDWVYYHDVLSRFSLQHWQKRTAASPEMQRLFAKPSKVQSSARRLVELLSEVCDAVLARPAPPVSGKKSRKDTEDYKNFLQILDWRIRSLSFFTPEIVENPEGDDSLLILELYQLALLIYLSRASNNMINQSFRTERYLAQAFSILPRLRSCNRQFPVFILGCEARNDEYRAVILDLISRTELEESSRSFNHVKLLLQAVWAQDDLADGEVDYWEKISYVISCCRIAPSFV
ncbi:fungal-specific transcription factor domain-containing protein [Cercophora samala]|uniref:Fungal-specific transcription factor domain-containing protein n=1 Tax=Cercophora samala TaxID=330535 RepID=A0AA40DCB5_9PEZI|nr:fungal-specific transcription factor domain-containing protein [Cercophora samala]